MSALPSCLIEPVAAELEGLLGPEPEFSPTHPWGCHRRRIPNRVVFEHVVAALVHGSGYELTASQGCSDRTIRRRLTKWAEQGIGQRLHQLALAAYDKIIGLHLDSGYDGAPSRTVLAEHGMLGEIATKGVPTPIQIGKRWVVERTNSWMNNYGKLRRCTDRNGTVVDFYLHLAAAFLTVRCLIQAARHTHRWPTRPTTRRLK